LTVSVRRGGRTRRGAALAVAAALCALLQEGGAHGQTMQETLAAAYQNNPTLSAARAALRATDEGVPQALSNWRPTVSAVGEIGKQRQDITGSGQGVQGTINHEPRRGTLTVTQPLFRGGRTIAQTRRAENQVLSDRAVLLRTEQQVLQQAASAYMNVVRDQAVVELNRNNERVILRQLEATRDRFRVGEVTRTDVAQAESRLSRATADRIASEGSLVQSRANYRAVVGESPGRLSTAPPLANLPASEDEAVSIARTKNFDVLRADYAERAARDQIDENFGGLLPEAALVGELEEARNTNVERSENDQASVTARVTVPLYTAGAVESRIRQAKQIAGQRRDERNQAVRSAIETATQAWERLNTARASRRAFTDVVRSAEIALEGVQQEALVGSRTVLDTLDAEQELVTARVNLVTAERDEVVASYDVRLAIGTLTAEALNLPVERYDPLKNYNRVRDRWRGYGIENE
jgi:outer membrane protein